jgi:hypothetical protein
MSNQSNRLVYILEDGRRVYPLISKHFDGVLMESLEPFEENDSVRVPVLRFRRQIGVFAYSPDFSVFQPKEHFDEQGKASFLVVGCDSEPADAEYDQDASLHTGQRVGDLHLTL